MTEKILKIQLSKINLNTHAFVVPDYELIKNRVQNSVPDFNYELLFNKYLNFDNLTPDQYHFLYYGSCYYNFSYENVDWSDIRAEIISSIQNIEIEKVYVLIQKLLKNYSFRIDDLLYAADIYKKLGKYSIYRKILNHIHNLLITIINTGNGLDANTGFHILDICNEYTLINFLDLCACGKQSVFSINNETIDRIEVFRNNHNAKYLFYNVTEMMKRNRKEIEKYDDFKNKSDLPETDEYSNWRVEKREGKRILRTNNTKKL